MGLEDITQFSLFVLIAVFVVLCVASLISFSVAKQRKGRTWGQHYPHLLRSFLIRLAIAATVAVSAFALVTAALVLNSHRPPGDHSPVIRVDGRSGPITVDLAIDDCRDPITGTISTGPGRSAVRIYSDGQGVRRLTIDGDRRASFTLDGVIAKRGLLSCYAQLPVVRGGQGPSQTNLTVGEEMQLDMASSVPPAEAYTNGRWSWACPAGATCPVLATVNYAIEDGTKQVIVLVLAALFGSIIALFIGEALIEPIRRRLDRDRPDRSN